MIEIIPAIDIIGGKCVRLSKGDYTQKRTYNEYPLEVAKKFQDLGCKRLHLVDLDGAKSDHIVNHHILESIASHTNLIIDFGGGIKSDEDVRIAFDSGAAMITGGSVAIKNPEIFKNWIQQFGAERIVLGADVRKEKIASNGWIENSNTDIIPFISEYKNLGIDKVISTDIDCDGMLEGPSVKLYEKILADFPDLYLIASGGVSGMNDIEALQKINVPAVIVGKALYEGQISTSELEKYNISIQC